MTKSCFSVKNTKPGWNPRRYFLFVSKRGSLPAFLLLLPCSSFLFESFFQLEVEKTKSNAQHSKLLCCRSIKQAFHICIPIPYFFQLHQTMLVWFFKTVKPIWQVSVDEPIGQCKPDSHSIRNTNFGDTLAPGQNGCYLPHMLIVLKARLWKLLFPKGVMADAAHLQINVIFMSLQTWALPKLSYILFLLKSRELLRAEKCSCFHPDWKKVIELIFKTCPISTTIAGSFLDPPTPKTSILLIILPLHLIFKVFQLIIHSGFDTNNQISFNFEGSTENREKPISNHFDGPITGWVIFRASKNLFN